jgi:predicted nucleotidyltransferase
MPSVMRLSVCAHNGFKRIEVQPIRGGVMLDIDKFKPEIGELCRRLRISRLDVFGSATSESFCADSDVDVLVRFEQDGGRLFSRYFDLKEGLEKIFGRPVDVVTEDSLKNPYFKASVERSRKLVYAG